MRCGVVNDYNLRLDRMVWKVWVERDEPWRRAEAELFEKPSAADEDALHLRLAEQLSKSNPVK